MLYEAENSLNDMYGFSHHHTIVSQRNTEYIDHMNKLHYDAGENRAYSSCMPDNSLLRLNQDPSPILIRKKPIRPIYYTQNVAVKFLRPPSPPPPGDILIRQERDIQAPPAPPLRIQQKPSSPIKPPPLIIREQPPPKPAPIAAEHHVIPGRVLPPPPRKVIVEKMPKLPQPPRDIIIERWLSYPERKRNVVFRPAPPPSPILPQKNVIIQWDTPDVALNRQIRHLGVSTADPREYYSRFGQTMVQPEQLPAFAHGIRPRNGERLAADRLQENIRFVGDVDALKLIGKGTNTQHVVKPCVVKQKKCALSSSVQNTVTFAPKARVIRPSHKYQNYVHEYIDSSYTTDS